MGPAVWPRAMCESISAGAEVFLLAVEAPAPPPLAAKIGGPTSPPGFASPKSPSRACPFGGIFFLVCPRIDAHRNRLDGRCCRVTVAFMQVDTVGKRECVRLETLFHCQRYFRNSR